jgi:hypothetical protein
MSLEATHIRFALDFKEKFEVQDMKKYISGAVYPDSRYISGIDRSLTHGEVFLTPDLSASDFEKGCQAHQICDKIHNRVRKTIFPDLFPVDYPGYDEQEWVIATALKIIQDMDDVQAFDIQKYLECLDYVENSNKEDILLVEKYNRTLVNLYRGKKVPSVDDYNQLWRAFGVDENLGEELRHKTEEFLKDENIIGRSRSVYQEMIKYYQDTLKNDSR